MQLPVGRSWIPFACGFDGHGGSELNDPSWVDWLVSRSMVVYDHCIWSCHYNGGIQISSSNSIVMSVLLGSNQDVAVELM